MLIIYVARLTRSYLSYSLHNLRGFQFKLFQSNEYLFKIFPYAIEQLMCCHLRAVDDLNKEDDASNSLIGKNRTKGTVYTLRS